MLGSVWICPMKRRTRLSSSIKFTVNLAIIIREILHPATFPRVFPIPPRKIQFPNLACLYFYILLRPSCSMGLTLGWVVASKLFKRGDWVGYTQSTLLPQQLLGRTVAWAFEPALHWRCMVGQSATGHEHLPQFWISARWIAINLRAESLCTRSPPRGGLQPWLASLVLIK